jgi:hypothetical protein
MNDTHRWGQEANRLAIEEQFTLDVQTTNSGGARASSKTCEFCSQPAQYSLAFVLSTVGTRPRRQKCSSVVLICDKCIREFYESDPQIPEELQNALRRAYTTINSAPTDHGQRPETEL